MNDRLRIIGITGGVGTGKTTVANLYALMHNAYVIFTDLVAKDLQVKGNSCYNLIVEHFGNVILSEDYEINREKLAQIVFNDEEELNILNSIVHKEVIIKVKEIIEEISHNGEYNIILLESAILFQVDELRKLCTEIWYVDSLDTDRRKRLKRERDYSDERITSMINSQEGIHLIKDKCDKVITNNKDLEQLKDILANM
ncbi:MAG: dephospho-CoA kinase [Lachnospiraceae bacterium]|nr:dephospho-CoA kinase [Lachnospiraceae bacterium]